MSFFAPDFTIAKFVYSGSGKDAVFKAPLPGARIREDASYFFNAARQHQHQKDLSVFVARIRKDNKFMYRGYIRDFNDGPGCLVSLGEELFTCSSTAYLFTMKALVNTKVS